LLTQCGRHEGEGGGPPYSGDASFSPDAHEHFRGNVAAVDRPA